MTKSIREIMQYCLLEKIPLLKVGKAIHICKNDADRVEDMCGWKFEFPEKVQTFMFFAIGLCIYAIISFLFNPLADAFAADICKTLEIPHIFFPVVKLIATFFVDKKVCECLDELA